MSRGRGVAPGAPLLSGPPLLLPVTETTQLVEIVPGGFSGETQRMD